MFEKVIAGLASNRELLVRGCGKDQVDLLIQKPYGVPYGIAIADKDIPSLMLALGEAAGVVPEWKLASKIGTPKHLGHILYHLRQYAEAQEAIAAQAEETAKLEAEALELYEMHREIVDYEACPWEYLDDVNKRYWVALARKAWEIGN